MSKPIRVLQVFASLNRGGAESMIMNVYRNIDRSKVQFDFVENEASIESDFVQEIQGFGGRIFHVPRYVISNHHYYKGAWQKLLREHPEHKIVHAHHTTPAYIYLSIAKGMGRYTIAHSHTAGGDNNAKSILKTIMRNKLCTVADKNFACSDMAGMWMFRKRNYLIIKNAIDARKFTYNNVRSENMRMSLNVMNKFVIGHIGNFSKAKNYPFILEVFKSVFKRYDNAILMLVGKNENNPEIEKKVREMELDDKVVFTGVRSDIPELIQSMDVFLFPSLFEGLGVVLIEAQAAGLKCIASTAVPKEAKITEQLEFIDLDKGAEYWADKVLEYQNGYERKNTYEDIVKTGYDIKETTKWLQEFYLNSATEKK